MPDPDIEENVAASNIEVELLKPADVLQQIKLSETHIELSQPVLAMEARKDVEKSPKSTPVAETSAAPVDGEFLVALEDIEGGWHSGTCTDEMLRDLKANEIVIPGTFR